MDRSIEHAVAELLSRSPYQQLRNVRCEFTDGVLILHGQVPSFHMKQLAFSVARSLNDEVDVDNRIEVLP